MQWKMATFNVNGLRARLPVLLSWLAEQAPQVMCLQETKVPDADFPATPLEELGYHVHFHGQKSFNGVAVLSRSQPTRVVRGFPGQEDAEARLLLVEVDGVQIINCYVPQGRSPEDPAFQRKLAFLTRLLQWLGEDFSVQGQLLITGDLNVAPQDQDVYDPVKLAGQVGCHPREREALAALMDWGLTDLFRLHHPQERQFTFWDYRLPKGLQRNLGWRIDHVLATPSLAERCTQCLVDVGPREGGKPSDHTPLWASFNL